MLGLLAALALVALNGFFVAAEFSMVRVRPAQLQRLEKKGVPGASSALKVAREIDRYLSVSQIGITLCSLALGWIGEPAFAWIVEHAWFAATGRAMGGRAHAIGAGVAFATITYLHVLLGEQIPKLIALHRAESAALFLARPFRIMFYLLAPVRFLIEGATRIVLRAFGLKGGIPGEGELSEEELTSIIAATLARGPRAEDKRALLERVVRFASRQARHAMVPRVDIKYLPVATSGRDAIAFLRQQEYTRIVLTERDDVDRVVGYLYSKDLLLDPKNADLPDLSSIRRDILYVPEPQSLIDVLRAMQQAQTLFALVVDEYGGTSGLLTMEDLLEEIVGEIRDEADEEEQPRLRELPGMSGTWDVDPLLPLDELRGIGIDTPEGSEGETLGGYLVRELGRIPKRGDRMRLGPFDAEIRAVRRRRVLRVRLHPHAPTIHPPAASVQIKELDYETDADTTLPPGS
jgi:CBS domain containing-hemolysin-like protein